MGLRNDKKQQNLEEIWWVINSILNPFIVKTFAIGLRSLVGLVRSLFHAYTRNKNPTKKRATLLKSGGRSTVEKTEHSFHKLTCGWKLERTREKKSLLKIQTDT